MRSLNVLVNPVPRQATNEDDPFLYDASHQIDLGTFEDIVHTGEREVGFEVSGSLADPDPRYGGRRDAHIVLGFRDNQVSYHKGTISFDHGERQLPWSWSRGPIAGTPQSSVEVLGRNFMFSATDYPTMLQFAGISGVTIPDPAQAVELSSFASRLHRPQLLYLSQFTLCIPCEASKNRANQSHGEAKRVLTERCFRTELWHCSVFWHTEMMYWTRFLVGSRTSFRSG
jgi:hypothetical protein